MEKTTLIEIEEKYGEVCFNDACNVGKKSERRPQGFVKIYEVDKEGNKQLVGKSNLVLYSGREFIAVRIVNVVNAGVSQTPDEFISWLGLGDGGVAIADPFDPLPPINNNPDLLSEVLISTIDPSLGDYRVGFGYYKLPFTQVTFEQDTANDDRWLIFNIVVTVGGNHANGFIISEAGLFTAESDVPGPTSLGPFHIFARATFPAIVKTPDRQLVFSWFIYT